MKQFTVDKLSIEKKNPTQYVTCLHCKTVFSSAWSEWNVFWIFFQKIRKTFSLTFSIHLTTAFFLSIKMWKGAYWRCFRRIRYKLSSRTTYNTCTLRVRSLDTLFTLICFKGSNFCSKIVHELRQTKNSASGGEVGPDKSCWPTWDCFGCPNLYETSFLPL